MSWPLFLLGTCYLSLRGVASKHYTDLNTEPRYHGAGAGEGRGGGGGDNDYNINDPQPSRHNTNITVHVLFIHQLVIRNHRYSGDCVERYDIRHHAATHTHTGAGTILRTSISHTDCIVYDLVLTFMTLLYTRANYYSNYSTTHLALSWGSWFEDAAPGDGHDGAHL